MFIWGPSYKICHCALPAITGGTSCCEFCSNNSSAIYDSNYFKVPEIKKETIEKYDEKGNLIERITRDL